MEQSRLIIRALLGNHEAAKRLTDAGVLLPCPMCGDTPHIVGDLDKSWLWYECSCGAETGACQAEHEAMLLWNTRAPILSSEEMEMLDERSV